MERTKQSTSITSKEARKLQSAKIRELEDSMKEEGFYTTKFNWGIEPNYIRRVN